VFLINLVLCQYSPIHGAMPNCDSITLIAVIILLSGAYHDSYHVQVISVVEGCSSSGGKKYKVIISDGVDILDCFVAPQMFHLFVSKAKDQYNIVSIHCASVTEMCGHTKVVLVDIRAVSKHSTVVGVLCLVIPTV